LENFSSGILILTSTLAYLEEHISHNGPRGAQKRIATIVKAAWTMDIAVHVCDCIYNGVQLSPRE